MSIIDSKKSLMKKYLPFLFFFSLSSAFAQSKLGDVACVYINTPNLDSSVAFYEKLGFPQTGSNTFPVPWAQVSDGSLIIMMRKDEKPFIGLTYYVNDIEAKIAQLEKDSIVFSQKPKTGDPVKRYFITSPDGFSIMLVPNIGQFKAATGKTLLNMPQADYTAADKYPNKQLGAFGEFCHPVKDLKASLLFWKKLGFEVKGDMKQPYPHAILYDGLMIIGLHQTNNFDYPAITYFGVKTETRIKELKEKELGPFTEMAGKNNQVLLTWEKQHFFIFALGM